MRLKLQLMRLLRRALQRLREPAEDPLDHHPQQQRDPQKGPQGRLLPAVLGLHPREVVLDRPLPVVDVDRLAVQQPVEAGEQHHLLPLPRPRPKPKQWRSSWRRLRQK